MDVPGKSQRIELAAARQSVAWKAAFDRELQKAARECAGDRTLITLEHLQAALPVALGRLMESAQKTVGSTSHAKRRSA
jgi:hypothetical protein